MVAQGESLSRLLHQGQIGWSAMLLALLAAFAFGAVHALSPAHGKTLVAAYLVGSRGTPRHAVFLGPTPTLSRRGQGRRPECPGRERRAGPLPFRAGAAADFGIAGPPATWADPAGG